MAITRLLTRLLVAGGLACAALAPVAPVRAQAPERIDISEPFSFLAEDYCDVAGFSVQIDGLFENRLTIHRRRGAEYFAEHQIVTETHTSGDNEITVVSKPFFKDLHVDEVGDTLVITAFGTGPLSVYGPGGKAIARNPGQFRFRVTIDAETGEELDFVVLKESTGRTDDFCAAVLPVLMG
jgi:hypothetical protein